MNSTQALLARYGREVTLRRPPATDVAIQAKIVGYALEELIGEVTQNDRKVVIAADDLSAWAASPAIPRNGDQVIVAGKTGVVRGVESRHLGADVVRYDLRVTGLL